jgi:hypothetical protein
MALFKSKAAYEEPPQVTGVDVLREALRNRNSRPGGIAGLKDELKVPLSAIDDFINGVDGALSASQLDRAAKFMWGGMVEFDGSENRLRSANANPAKPLGPGPGPNASVKSQAEVSAFFGAPPPQPAAAPRPVIEPPPATTAAAWPARPGWSA